MTYAESLSEQDLAAQAAKLDALAELKTFYITFGQKYRYEWHPHAIKDVYPHPDGWFEIRRRTYDEAHAAAMRAFGGQFAFLYTEPEWQPEWYCRGKLGELS